MVVSPIISSLVLLAPLVLVLLEPSVIISLLVIPFLPGTSFFSSMIVASWTFSFGMILSVIVPLFVLPVGFPIALGSMLFMEVGLFLDVVLFFLVDERPSLPHVLIFAQLWLTPLSLSLFFVLMMEAVSLVLLLIPRLSLFGIVLAIRIWLSRRMLFARVVVEGLSMSLSSQIVILVQLIMLSIFLNDLLILIVPPLFLLLLLFVLSRVVGDQSFEGVDLGLLPLYS